MRNDYSKFTGNWYFLPGRFSPFHLGHKKLICTALAQFGKVQIGIRNTPISEKNPFTIEQRKKMIEKEFQQEIKKGIIDIVVIKDIVGVIRGRKVGWGIFDIELDKETEAISATKIRKRMKNNEKKKN